MSLPIYDEVDLSHAVRGSGVVELFEHGKCVERVVSDNFISTVMKARTRQAVRANYAPSSALIGANHTDPVPIYPLTHLLLTADDSAEVAASEAFALGQVVGWANKSGYVGADTKRGGTNSPESAAGPTQIKYVFDWPTHAANGTFQSLAWVRGHDQWGLQYDEWDWYGAASPSYPGEGGAYDPASDSFVFRAGYQNGETWRIHRVTRAVTQITGSSNPSEQRIIGLANGKIWTWTLNDNNFRSHDIGTSTIDDTVTGAKANVTGTFRMATIKPDDTEFWAINTTDATVQRLDRTTGAHLGTIPLPWAPLRIGTIGDDILIVSTSRTSKWARVTSSGEVVWEISLGDYLYSSEVAWIAASEAGGQTWLAAGLSSSNQAYHMHRMDTFQSLGTRLLLPDPVTKTSAQTLKVTYQFDFA